MNLTCSVLVLFISGFILSYFVEKYKIEFLKKMPKWFMEKIAWVADAKNSFWYIMMFIFLFNSISIFIYMLSAVTILGPLLIIIMTGLNIGIIIQEQPDLTEIGQIKSPNPIIAAYGLIVLFIEIFVFCFSLAMGLSMASQLLTSYSINRILALIGYRIWPYLFICVPLLIFSAFLETKAIKDTQK